MDPPWYVLILYWINSGSSKPKIQGGSILLLRGAEGDVAIQISFSYDNDGLLTNAGDLSLTRDSDHGLITATSLSSITTDITYTGFGELDTDTVDYSGMTLYALDLGRDNLGRITTKTESISGTTSTYVYTYDTAGRLDTVTIDGTLTSDYGYDDNGNRTSPTSATYDDQDRLTTYGSNTYTYTDNGELLTKINADGTTTYTYDALVNLISVVIPGADPESSDTIEYIIDGQNRRVGKKYNGTLMQGFLYDNQLHLIAELNSDNTLESRFIYASKPNVPDYMVKDGSTYRIISDHLGSVRFVVDVSSGTTMQQITYDEWQDYRCHIPFVVNLLFIIFCSHFLLINLY